MTDANATLDMWTIYDHPTDYPDEYVARRWIVMSGGGFHGTGEVLRERSLAQLRDIMRGAFHLTCIPRHEVDDPVIVETWL